jgi:hypothetical protein
MDHLIGAALDPQGDPRATEICIDFTDLDFVDVVGVTVLSNLIERIKRRGATVKFQGCDRRYEGVKYLDDCGFFQEYQGGGLSQWTQLRSTTYPFRKLSCEQSHHFLNGDLVPWLARSLGVPVSSLHPFKTCVREIFNNIQDHSTEQIGCMHMQVYPRVDQVVVAVSDFGVGIPQAVRRVKSVASDYDALLLATKAGFTSKSTAGNMGAGLNYLIETVVQQNHGFVQIYSGLGRISFNYDESSPRGGTTLSLYPGTLVSMMLPKENLPEPDDEGSEEVSW